MITSQINRSDDLFQLVHALDRTEKAYFKKFCSLYGKRDNRTYLRLFGYLVKQSVYDEKKLRLHFKDERFIRQLPVARNYLFNLVLRSLESYHYSVDAELGSQLHRMAILFEKGLYDTCGRVLARAQKLAEKYERHTYLLEFCQWEIELARARSYAGKSEAEINAVFEKIFRLLETSRNVNEYSALVSGLFMKELKGGFARNKKGLKRYDSIIGHPLLKKEPKGLSYQARFYFLLSYIGYHSVRNEYAQAHTYSRQLVDWIEAHPHQAAEKPRAYVAALKNLVTCLGKLKRYEAIPPVLEKMKAIPTRSKALQKSIFYSTTILGMETCIHTGDFEAGLELVKRSETQRARLGAEPLNKLNETILNYTTCCIFFGAGNFPAANQYLNRILNDTQSDLRSDILSFARILQLLIHYELGNTDLLPYLIRSTYRYLYKRKSLYRFEAVVLSFIRKKLPGTASRKELLHAFAALKKEIVKLSRDPFGQTALEYFDFISWLESKISGRRFSDIVREKAGLN
jgi:hypothetical protein